jgi:hypothetical protein
VWKSKIVRDFNREYDMKEVLEGKREMWEEWKGKRKERWMKR